MSLDKFPLRHSNPADKTHTHPVSTTLPASNPLGYSNHTSLMTLSTSPLPEGMAVGALVMPVLNSAR